MHHASIGVFCNASMLHLSVTCIYVRYLRIHFNTRHALYVFYCCLNLCLARFILQLFDRVGEVEEVGRAVLFLATDATYCTAMDLTMSAGMELGGWK